MYSAQRCVVRAQGNASMFVMDMPGTCTEPSVSSWTSGTCTEPSVFIAYVSQSLLAESTLVGLTMLGCEGSLFVHGGTNAGETLSDVHQLELASLVSLFRSDVQRGP